MDVINFDIKCSVEEDENADLEDSQSEESDGCPKEEFVG